MRSGVHRDVTGASVSLKTTNRGLQTSVDMDRGRCRTAPTRIRMLVSRAADRRERPSWRKTTLPEGASESLSAGDAARSTEVTVERTVGPTRRKRTRRVAKPVRNAGANRGTRVPRERSTCSRDERRELERRRRRGLFREALDGEAKVCSGGTRRSGGRAVTETSEVDMFEASRDIQISRDRPGRYDELAEASGASRATPGKPRAFALEVRSPRKGRRVIP